MPVILTKPVPDRAFCLEVARLEYCELVALSPELVLLVLFKIVIWFDVMFFAWEALKIGSVSTPPLAGSVLQTIPAVVS